MPEIKVTRAPDFRYVPADTITISFADNNARLIFAVEEPPENRLETVGVVMTHLTLKTLAFMITTVMEAHENATGKKVELAPEAVKKIQEMFQFIASSETTS